MNPFSKAFDVAATSLTGYASNVSGAAFVLTTTTPGDGLGHQVTVRNDSITDHSGKTIALVGYGPNGETLTETMTGPEGSATVTSTKFFKGLTSATPSATIGADTFDIGWAAAALSEWFVAFRFHQEHRPFSVGIAVAGTIDYDLEQTYDPDPGHDTDYWTNATIDGKTVKSDVGFASPITAFRVRVNSHTTGEFTVYSV